MRTFLPLIVALLLPITIPNQATSFPANFEDDRILVGAAHDVFVGKVVKRIGNSPIDSHTRFEVEVITTIKGDLRGRVFIDQLGGYRGKEFYRSKGDVIRPGNDAGMVKPGATYVFATRSPAVNSEKAHRLNSHPNGHALISSDGNLSTPALKEAAESSDRVKQLRQAYQNEIIPEVFQKDARNRWTELKVNDATP